MAILKSSKNEYEVRIKRYPEKTYFDEYVKTGDQEKSSATACDRYVIGEDGVRYTIEVTLKKGFSFGNFECVRVKLYIPGQKDSISEKRVGRPTGYEGVIKSDITTELQYADVTVDGNRILGARFCFRNLCLDEKLVNETDIMGIGPKSLGHFVVKVYKLRWETRQLTDNEYRENAAVAKNTAIWDAQKVDEDSFKRDGIAYAIGFVEGTRDTTEYIEPETVAKVPSEISRTKNVAMLGTKYCFNFYCRTSEFLEQTGIVKYPPPLHAYSWKDLDKRKRQISLKELQRINKEHVLSVLEAKTGKMHAKSRKSRGKDEPKEWRAWTKMSEWEKEEAFESLRKSRKAYERGETTQQYESRNGEIISLVDEDNEKPKKNEDVSLSAKPSPEPEEKSVNVAGGNAVQEIKVKSGAIDLEAPVSAPNVAPVPYLANIAEHRKATPARIENMDDGELERKRARAKALAEDIEMEERIAKLKRERRALEDEIEVAESKKKQRHGGEGFGQPLEDGKWFSSS